MGGGGSRHPRRMFPASKLSEAPPFTPPAPGRGWVPNALVPIGLVGWSSLPLLFGLFRLIELSGGPAILPPDARFSAVPLPVIVHVLASAAFCGLGAVQFAPALRRRPAQWHRRAGWLAGAAGLVAALSGVWMTLFYPSEGQANRLLILSRLGFGTAMTLTLSLGIVRAAQRELRRHRAWMIRAYALGGSAGTQTFLVIGWLLAFDEPNPGTTTLLMTAGWVGNLVVAEWLVHRRHLLVARKRDSGGATS